MSHQLQSTNYNYEHDHSPFPFPICFRFEGLQKSDERNALASLGFLQIITCFRCARLSAWIRMVYLC